LGIGQYCAGIGVGHRRTKDLLRARAMRTVCVLGREEGGLGVTLLAAVAARSHDGAPLPLLGKRGDRRVQPQPLAAGPTLTLGSCGSND